MKPTIHFEGFSKNVHNLQEAMRFLLQFGIDAPSSHNTQPWLFKLTANAIEVYKNKDRELAESDKNGRQLFLSIGCAIENILLAADYYGLSNQISYFPNDTDPVFVARITFKDFAPASHLDEHHLALEIPKRHANREPFEERPVPENFLAEIKKLEQPDLKILLVSDAETKAKAFKVVSDATVAAFRDKSFTKELSEWMRPSMPKYRDGMPGYNIGIPWLLSFIVPFMIRHGNVVAQQKKMVEVMLAATPTFLVIATEGDEPRDWVNAGATLERIWLMASRAGIKLGVFGAPIQIGDFSMKLQDALGTRLHPQVFTRIGFADKVPKASPRLPLADVITA